MAVAHLQSFSVNSASTPVTSQTLASVDGGQSGQSDRLLWVAALWRSTGETCNALDFGATGLTLDTGSDIGGIGIRTGWLASPAGIDNVVATMSAAVGMVWLIAKVFSGVNQVTPYATGPLFGDGSLGVQSLSTVIALPSGGMLADAIYIRDSSIGAALTADSPQVDDLSTSESVFGSSAGSSHDDASSDMGWSWGATFATGHQVSVALQQAAEVAGPAAWNWRRRYNRPAPFVPGLAR